MTKDQAKRIAAIVRRKVKESKLPSKSKYPVFLSKSGMSRVVKFWIDECAIEYSRKYGYGICVDTKGDCHFHSNKRQWVYHNLLSHAKGYPFSFSLLQSEVEFHLDPIDPPSIQDLPETIQKLLVNKPTTKAK